ncbi:MAG: hypothetical protein JKY86_01085 [Gammaproteobacteria bacterium]|nr:hypothetical protein [Gammaproteobacteria bacterium]
MWRSRISAIVTLVLASCSSELPEHDEFLSVKTRDELRRKFGAPLSIMAYEYGPDVISLKEQLSGEIPIFKFERWVYESENITNWTRSSVTYEQGKTIFSFWINKENSGDVIQDMSWMKDEEFFRYWK